jgi:hypothetical protein
MIVDFSGGASVFYYFHVNRSQPFLIVPTVGQLVLLGTPWRNGRAGGFQRGARQRFEAFHHLSHEAFRQWPRAGVDARGGNPRYTQRPEGCVTVEGRHT